MTSEAKRQCFVGWNSCFQSFAPPCQKSYYPKAAMLRRSLGHMGRPGIFLLCSTAPAEQYQLTASIKHQACKWKGISMTPAPTVKSSPAKITKLRKKQTKENAKHSVRFEFQIQWTFFNISMSHDYLLFIWNLTLTKYPVFFVATQLPATKFFQLMPQTPNRDKSFPPWPAQIPWIMCIIK